MSTCSICKSAFDSSEGTFWEWGLTCRPCNVAIQLTPAFTSPQGADVGATVALNVVGIGLAAVTGVGFTYGGHNDEPVPIPDAQRLQLAMPEIRARLQRERRRQSIYLRQQEDVRGPFTMPELAELWEIGKVGADDEYWYEGMDDYLPVADFKPPA